MIIAVAHAKSEQGAALAAAVLPVVRGLDDERARFYADLILISLNEADRPAVEAMMMGLEYQGVFAKKYAAHGEAKARASAVLTVLQVRGLAVPEDAHERILAEKEPARLERWLERAILAASIAEVLDEPS